MLGGPGVAEFESLSVAKTEGTLFETRSRRVNSREQRSVRSVRFFARLAHAEAWARAKRPVGERNRSATLRPPISNWLWPVAHGQCHPSGWMCRSAPAAAPLDLAGGPRSVASDSAGAGARSAGAGDHQDRRNRPPGAIADRSAGPRAQFAAADRQPLPSRRRALHADGGG